MKLPLPIDLNKIEKEAALMKERNDLERLAAYVLLLEIYVSVTKHELQWSAISQWAFMHLSDICDALADEYAPDGGKTLLNDFTAKCGGNE